MSRTVAEELIGVLAKADVQRIYRIVGDSLNPVTDAIRRSDKLRWMHVRHEETAAFAPGRRPSSPASWRSARAVADPATCTRSTGWTTPHRSMAPVLAVAAHISSSEVGTGYFQETHPGKLFCECNHFSELICKPPPVAARAAHRHAARGE